MVTQIRMHRGKMALLPSKRVPPTIPQEVIRDLAMKAKHRSSQFAGITVKDDGIYAHYRFEFKVLHYPDKGTFNADANVGIQSAKPPGSFLIEYVASCAVMVTKQHFGSERPLTMLSIDVLKQNIKHIDIGSWH